MGTSYLAPVGQGFLLPLVACGSFQAPNMLRAVPLLCVYSPVVFAVDLAVIFYSLALFSVAGQGFLCRGFAFPAPVGLYILSFFLSNLSGVYVQLSSLTLVGTSVGQGFCYPWP